MIPRPYRRIPLTVRFWKFVKKTPTCWEWHGYREPRGYGKIRIRKRSGNGETFRAHRLAWWLTTGEKLSGKYVLRHLCNNPSCVRPSHLRAGTQKDNVRQCIRDGRRAYLRGEQNGNSRLTSRIICKIRKSSAAGVALGRKYGVSGTSITAIRKRRTWKHVI